jgi:hypothetical protein
MQKGPGDVQIYKGKKWSEGEGKREKEKQPREMGCCKSDLESASYNGP